MDNIGAEVGQKMRSAIKAKLMELGCYVDDELPDYIMVMVANKRTKSQMNEDLQLFLGNKTETFVDWLQIVLKKLKEITVTNPDVYRKVSKHKLDTSPKSPVKVKKEKKEKTKSNKKIKEKKLPKPVIKDIPQIKSLTDDLPVEASKLSEMRKIVVLQENQSSNSISSIENVNEDSFDIPPLSEVALSNENELAEIEKKIKSVKSRLGLQVASESEDEDFINLKAEPDELFPSETSSSKQKKDDKASRKIKLLRTTSPANAMQENSNKLPESSISPKQRNEHPRIIFVNADPNKKLSALERLGKRPNNLELDESDSKRRKISLTNIRRQEEEILGVSRANDEQTHKQTTLTAPDEKRKAENNNQKGVVRESALKRLGVMSKVAVPQKDSTEEESLVVKEVPSAVKVKPRTMLPLNNQANKNLLLKAVAEAQRSIAQTPVVGANAKPDALYTKKYKEKIQTQGRKLSDKEKDKIRNILNQSDRKDKKELEFSSDDDDNLEYIPKPVRKVAKPNEHLEYIPSSKGASNLDYPGDLPKKSKGQTFIITLDGITRCQEQNADTKDKTDENKKRKSPSPIIFDANVTPPVVTKPKQIPERFPVALPLPLIKTKEKCKYWPMCRQGDKCEFVHPTTPCKAFPQCRFGEKCLYIHPTCKFETSCTRKDCPYNHVPKAHASVALQMCKFYPNCSNTHCMFYHPKMCKYGKYCKNQAECSFSHNFPVRSNFTWRSALKL